MIQSSSIASPELARIDFTIPNANFSTLSSAGYVIVNGIPGFAFFPITCFCWKTGNDIILGITFAQLFTPSGGLAFNGDVNGFCTGYWIPFPS